MKELDPFYQDVAEELWKHGYGNAHWSAGFLTCAITHGIGVDAIIEHITTGGNFTGPTWSMLQRFYAGKGEFAVISRKTHTDGKIDLKQEAVYLLALKDKFASVIENAMDGAIDPKSVNQLAAGMNSLVKVYDGIMKLTDEDHEERKKLPINVNVVQLLQGVENMVDPCDVKELRRMLMRKKKTEVIEVEGIVESEETKV